MIVALLELTVRLSTIFLKSEVVETSITKNLALKLVDQLKSIVLFSASKLKTAPFSGLLRLISEDFGVGAGDGVGVEVGAGVGERLELAEVGGASAIKGVESDCTEVVDLL